MISISHIGTALRPAMLLAAGLFAALFPPIEAVAAEARDDKTYKMLLAGEETLASVLQSRHGGRVAGVVSGLGHVVDEASARKNRGIKSSNCDLAAMALANVAMLTEKALEANGNLKSAFVEPAKTEVSQFATDMRSCEKHLGLPSTKREPLKMLLGKL